MKELNLIINYSRTIENLEYLCKIAKKKPSDIVESLINECAEVIKKEFGSCSSCGGPMEKRNNLYVCLDCGREDIF